MNDGASALPLIEALCSVNGPVPAATRLAPSVLPWLHGPDAGTRRAAPRPASTTSRISTK